MDTNITQQLKHLYLIKKIDIMEIEKLIKSLEILNVKRITDFKITFCEDNINVKKLLNEIKLCYKSSQ